MSRRLPSAWRIARLVVYSVLATTAVTSAAVAWDWLGPEPSEVLPLYLAVLASLLAGLAALLVLGRRRSARAARWLRAFDVVGANVVLILLAVEAFGFLAAHLAPSMFVRNEYSASSTLEALRPTPGSRIHGFPLNRGGYHDDEFFSAAPEDFVVALLADSFGVGIVPHRLNFATVTEHRLQKAVESRFERVAVHNLGVSGIGLNEYAYLMQQEVPALNPRVVVLCLFVGNDIEQGYLPHRTHWSYTHFQDWRAWWMVSRLPLGLAVYLLDPGLRAAAQTGPDPGEPLFSEWTYLNLIEKPRLRVTRPNDPGNRRRFREAFDALRHFDEMLRDRLLVVLIPDEFQVDDDLWDALMERVGDASQYDRDFPQAELLRFFENLKIPVLDLLPILREAQRDGPTYHLRDTHWNERGNRIAGLAIAEAIQSGWLEELQRATTAGRSGNAAFSSYVPAGIAERGHGKPVPFP
jgi:hypothetical protein